MSQELVKGDDRTPITAREAYEKCPGGGEAHDAHLDANGECPWCEVYDINLAQE